MNNKLSIILILLFGAALFGIGFFVNKSCSKPITEPVIIIKKDKSDSTIIANQKKQIVALEDSIKKTKAKIIIRPSVKAKYDTIQLPCDSTHVLDSLRRDIVTYNEIVTIQDSTIATAGRFNNYLIGRLTENDTVINALVRHVETQRIASIQMQQSQNKQRLRAFLTGTSIGTTIPVLLYFLLR